MDMTLDQALERSEILQAQNDELTRQIQGLVQTVNQYKHQIEQLLRRLHGPRSERFDPNQLFLDEMMKAGQAESAPTEEATIPVKATVKRKARPHGRSIIPDHLEREEILLDLPDEEKTDPKTGQDLVKLRDEVSEKLAWKPGNWFVKQFIRPIYVHPDRQSEDAGIYVRPMPDSPIEKCKADTSVLAWVAVQKWCDHLPLHRQRDIFKRQGVEVARSTLNAWAIEPILALEPLYEALKEDVLSRPFIFTDDTPVRLQVKGRGKTKTARMWVYVGGADPPHRFFDFTEDRKKERPGEILKNYQGYIHADAYSGYDHLFRSDLPLTEVGCWAHTRRKFDEAKTTAIPECAEILGLIGLLYKVEKEVRGQEPEQRLNARQKSSVSLMDKLYERLEELHQDALPASPLGKALTYAINQKEALQVYLTDGRLEMDNNTAENAIRPLALGRKNWMFAGSTRGGKACAIALSLLQSAKVLDLNPYDYLHDIYNRIMGHPVHRLDELLPAQWKASRESNEKT